MYLLSLRIINGNNGAEKHLLWHKGTMVKCWMWQHMLAILQIKPPKDQAPIMESLPKIAFYYRRLTEFTGIRPLTWPPGLDCINKARRSFLVHAGHTFSPFFFIDFITHRIRPNRGTLHQSWRLTLLFNAFSFWVVIIMVFPTDTNFYPCVLSSERKCLENGRKVQKIYNCAF